MITRLIFFMLLLNLSIVAYTQPKSTETFKDASETFLRVDGLYNTYDTTLLKCGERINRRYKTYCPLIIINNDRAIHFRGGSLDFSDLSIDFYYTLKTFKESIGEYGVENTKIKASLPIGLYVRGMRLKTFIANFEGEIKNRDTIINWRMVPPYPKAPKKFNEDFKDLRTPKLMYFIESRELLGLDSLYKASLQRK